MIGHTRRAPSLRGVWVSWHFFTGLPLASGCTVWLSCVGDFWIWIPFPCRETHRKNVKDSSCWYRYVCDRVLECLLHLYPYHYTAEPWSFATRDILTMWMLSVVCRAGLQHERAEIALMMYPYPDAFWILVCTNVRWLMTLFEKP